MSGSPDLRWRAVGHALNVAGLVPVNKRAV
jgi:hypothetical protein